jgi:hypothetical protein
LEKGSHEMGSHRKQQGLNVIGFIHDVGTLLGYFVQQEEPMFPGTRTTPILDVTWRKRPNERYPLFIFEIESTPTKNMADNALKVFSRPTNAYPKPLFFYHIIVNSVGATERDNYLREAYDKVNYDIYLLSDPGSAWHLMEDIIAQHARMSDDADLAGLIHLIEQDQIFESMTQRMLNAFVELRLDSARHLRFIETLEEIILSHNFESVRTYYLSYLPQFLYTFPSPTLNYLDPFYISFYSYVTHHTIYCILGKDVSITSEFDALRKYEASFDSFSLWYPAFGLSKDHDELLLSEFPLMMTLLCLAFESTVYSKYFSRKLRDIVVRSGLPNGHNIDDIHCRVWLLIASQIANDRESYDFAREQINTHGGLSTDRIVTPTVFCTYESWQGHKVDGEDMCLIPTYDQWSQWLRGIVLLEEDDDLLRIIIESFLVMHSWKQARSKFARFCLVRSAGRGTAA